MADWKTVDALMCTLMLLLVEVRLSVTTLYTAEQLNL